MNKRGFTLIELLTVIILISVLAIVVVPTLINVIEKRRNDLYVANVAEIENAASKYVSLHPELLLEEDFNIEMSDLCSYLECPIINPKNKEEMNGYVEVEVNGDDYTYVYKEE